MNKDIDILLNGGTAHDKEVALCNLQKIVSNYETIVSTLGKEFREITRHTGLTTFKKQIKIYRDYLVGTEFKKYIEVEVQKYGVEVMIFFHGYNLKFNIPFYDENGRDRQDELEDFAEWMRRK